MSDSEGDLPKLSSPISPEENEERRRAKKERKERREKKRLEKQQQKDSMELSDISNLNSRDVLTVNTEGGKKEKKPRKSADIVDSVVTTPTTEVAPEESAIEININTPTERTDDPLSRYRFDREPSYDINEEEGLAFREGMEEDLIRKEPMTFKRVLDGILDSWGTIIFTLLWMTLFIVGGTVLWKDLSWKAWITMVNTMVCITVLIKDWFPSHIVMLVAMVVLMVFEIVTVKQALSGFSNEALITIIVLFVVAKTNEVTRAVDLITRYVLRNPKRVWEAQLRLCIPISILSAFMNNTPIVAMMIPAVENWSTRTGIARSKLMLPLSFCTVMGGVLSIIGTSTNLVVKGIIEDDRPDIKIGFFEVGAVGAPVAVAGIIYIIVGSIWLLPDKKSLSESYLENPREYAITLLVKKNSSSIGKSIVSAGLRNLHGAFLFRIERQDETISAPDPSTVIHEGDLLSFAGVAESMKELLLYDGLVPSTAQVDKLAGKKKHRYLVEVVISAKSPLIGMTVLKSSFRKRYNAAIIAVHRSGIRIEGNIAEIVFQAGDTLLIESGKTFLKYHKNDSNFALVNQLTNNNVRKEVPLWKTILSIVVTAAMVLVSTLEVISLVTAALIAVIIFLCTKCLTLSQAADSMRGDIIILIGTAFSLGLAMEETGAGEALSNTLFGFLLKGGRYPLLLGIYIVTVLLTAVFSNAGTVILVYPITKKFVEMGALDIRALIFTLMIGGSCSFLTPIGYQTDMMVMGPGGYSFMDYTKFGVPLTIIITIVASVVTHLIWNL